MAILFHLMLGFPAASGLSISVCSRFSLPPLGKMLGVAFPSMVLNAIRQVEVWRAGGGQGDLTAQDAAGRKRLPHREYETASPPEKVG